MVRISVQFPGAFRFSVPFLWIVKATLTHIKEHILKSAYKNLTEPVGGITCHS